MTHRAARPGRRREKGWLLPLAGIVLILIAVAAQLISRAIVIDFLAWWPVWLVLGALAFFTRGRKVGRLRLPALVPLLAIVILGVFVYGYFAAWEVMPSAIGRLNGPVEGPATVASISTEGEAELEVRQSDAGFLYTVVPRRHGGSIGLPLASEQMQGSTIDITLASDPESGLYTYSGWHIGLSPVPIWRLDLAGELDVDVSDLVVSDLRLRGSGLVSLGSPPTEATAEIDGDFRLSVPAEVTVVIEGEAEVPADWVRTARGWASPTAGEGWVIAVVDGSSVRVEES